mmetsp:Transcript_115654/g.326991  ORF Transcript_115654/g.326991 Transcript_115654/m.326991 type:complete len:716 (-) Transcript_115654:99-2246(-)
MRAMELMCRSDGSYAEASAHEPEIVRDELEEDDHDAMSTPRRIVVSIGAALVFLGVLGIGICLQRGLEKAPSGVVASPPPPVAGGVPAPAAPLDLAGPTVRELFESTELAEVMTDNMLDRTSGINPEQRSHIQADVHSGLKVISKWIAGRFPASSRHLDTFRLTPERRDAVFDVMRRLRDRRLQKVGYNVGRVVRSAVINSTSSADATFRMVQGLAPHYAEIRRLRDEVLPESMRHSGAHVRSRWSNAFLSGDRLKMFQHFGKWRMEVKMGRATVSSEPFLPTGTQKELQDNRLRRLQSTGGWTTGIRQDAQSSWDTVANAFSSNGKVKQVDDSMFTKFMEFVMPDSYDKYSNSVKDYYNEIKTAMDGQQGYYDKAKAAYEKMVNSVSTQSASVFDKVEAWMAEEQFPIFDITDHFSNVTMTTMFDCMEDAVNWNTMKDFSFFNGVSDCAGNYADSGIMAAKAVGNDFFPGSFDMDQNGGGTGGGGHGKCFPGEAIVTVRGSGRTRVADVEIGDEVLTEHAGLLAYEPVLAYLHQRPASARPDAFVTVVHEQGKLRASAAHLVMCADVDSADTADLRHRRSDKPVQDLRPGDVLLVAALNNGEALVPSRVLELRQSSSHLGMYAPMTASGTLIVDRVLVSNYAGAREYVSIPHGAFHALFFPLRLYHRLRLPTYLPPFLAESDGVDDQAEKFHPLVDIFRALLGPVLAAKSGSVI